MTIFYIPYPVQYLNLLTIDKQKIWSLLRLSVTVFSFPLAFGLLQKMSRFFRSFVHHDNLHKLTKLI